MSRRGISVEKPRVMAWVRLLLGCRAVADRAGKVTKEPQWAETPIPVPLDTLVLDAKEEMDLLDPACSTVEECFPVGSLVYLLSEDNYYGCRATVLDNKVEIGRVKVRAELPPEPDLRRVAESESQIGLKWYSGSQASRRLAVSGHFVSRITGTVYVTPGARPKTATTQPNSDTTKHNIGLGLKSSKKGEEVADFTRRLDGDNGRPLWEYSSKVLSILTDYHNK